MASVHEGHRERLREQYLDHGMDGFLDHQVLELLLTYVIPRRDTNELAHRLLQRFGSLEEVLKADVYQLETVDGIGRSAALYLHMQGDVMRRISIRRLEDKQGQIRLTTPLVSAKLAISLLSSEYYEAVYFICLNKNRTVLCTKQVSRGSVSESFVYPRVVTELALLHHAHTGILIHNHPSGDPTPSDADLATTEAVSAALESVGIALLDHLIVSGRFVYSQSANAVIGLINDDQYETLSADEFVQKYIEAPRTAMPRVEDLYPPEPYLLRR